jgi:hypothetical protein
MAFPRVPNVLSLPARVEHYAQGKLGLGAQHTVVPAYQHTIEPAWNAYAKIDPVGAAMIRQMNPTTPAGLFNLGTILVPGGKGALRGPHGGTPAQEAFLEAIYNSSRGRGGEMIDPTDPKVAALMADPVTGAALIGSPNTRRLPAYNNLVMTNNPVTALRQGPTLRKRPGVFPAVGWGPGAGRGSLQDWGAFLTYLNRVGSGGWPKAHPDWPYPKQSDFPHLSPDRAAAVQRILRNSAINRRN